MGAHRGYCAGSGTRTIHVTPTGSGASRGSTIPADRRPARRSIGRQCCSPACPPFGEALQPWILYGGQGLRIILQTGPPQAGVQKVRITGVTSTLPPPKTSRIGSETLSALSALIELVFGLAENVGVVDVGIRLPEESEAPIIFAKTAPPEGYPSDDYSYNGTSYQLVMRVNLNVRGGLEPIAQRPLIAFADADVFVQDPVSKFGAAISPSTGRAARGGCWTTGAPTCDSATFRRAADG